MLKSKIAYSKEFEECENEELRKTGLIQSGFDVLVFDKNTLVAKSSNLSIELTDGLLSINDIQGTKIADSEHEIIEIEGHGTWLRHTKSQYTILERSGKKCPFEAISQEEYQKLLAGNLANLWKLSDRICRLISEKVKAQRVMIYQFHGDWSGEVIAERVIGSAEQFLGLRYPPTDIPKIARELYVETKTRHLFNLHPPVDLIGQVQNSKLDEIDLSHSISRSISPFHIEYLKNMGSASTLSCAIMFDGKLWGLLSLHFSEKRQASIQEYVYMQSLISNLNPLFLSVIEKEKIILANRSEKAVEQLMDNLEEEIEPFQTIMLSDLALHKITGGQGVSLVIDDEIASIGNVPQNKEIMQLARHIQEQHESGSYFFEQCPIDISLSNGVAGIAVHYLCKKPFSCVFVFRKMLNQTISWGGDPRHFVKKDEENLRYTPRKSFKRWVENIEGQSAAWNQNHKNALVGAFARVKAFLEVDDGELAILLRSGMRRAIKKRENIRLNTSEVIDSIASGIAIGIERGIEGSSEIVAINNVTAESLNVSHTDLIGASMSDFASLLGVELMDDESIGESFTISTVNNGIRDVELRQGLMFDYVNMAKSDVSVMKLVIYEFIDITEATRIKNSLIAARDQAISENDRRNEMMAKLSHELKTPLHALLGLSDILRRQTDDKIDVKVKKLIESMHQSASLMNDMIQHSLKGSSLIDTVDRRNFRNIEIQVLIGDLLGFLQPLADKKQVSLTVLGGAETVYAEPRGIRQVIINLVENAIKYNNPGGEVWIKVSTDSFMRTSIIVEDTGFGMTEEQLQKCTQAYQRFSNQDGSGLGLSIAESLVRAMGGQFSMSSKLGVGTIMTVNMHASN